MNALSSRISPFHAVLVRAGEDMPFALNEGFATKPEAEALRSSLKLGKNARVITIKSNDDADVQERLDRMNGAPLAAPEAPAPEAPEGEAAAPLAEAADEVITEAEAPAPAPEAQASEPAPAPAFVPLLDFVNGSKPASAPEPEADDLAIPAFLRRSRPEVASPTLAAIAAVMPAPSAPVADMVAPAPRKVSTMIAEANALETAIAGIVADATAEGAPLAMLAGNDDALKALIALATKAANLAKPAPRTRGPSPARPVNTSGKSKREIVAEMLLRPEGATRAELLAATGWPTMSVQDQAKASGLTLRQMPEGRGQRYWGAKPEAAPAPAPVNVEAAPAPEAQEGAAA